MKEEWKDEDMKEERHFGRKDGGRYQEVFVTLVMS